MSSPYITRTPLEQNLCEAFASLSTSQDVANFLRDLLTSAELTEFSHRLEIARLLKKGKPYLEIAKEVGVSTTTVTRVAQWLKDGCGGYEKALS
jgi:TrpR-related protein YerC/YecD